MKADKREFHVSSEEFSLLRRLAEQDKVITDLLESHEIGPGQKTIVRLSKGGAQQLREFLTTQLAKVGFDNDYSIKPQGQVLEDLIDRFFIN